MVEGDRVRILTGFPGKHREGTVTALNKKKAWVDLGDRNFVEFAIEDLEVLNQYKERVYLFRAKRLDNGKWVEGDLMRNICGTHIVQYKESKTPVGHRADWKYIPVDDNTVGQFTGMYDYNGNKIFDGDILDNQTPLGTPTEMKFRAEWIEAGFVIVYYGHRYGPVEKDNWKNRYPLCRNNVKDLRIIGNRWDNPDIISENND